MKTKFFLTVILASFINNLSAYPISPRPLRKLIMEAENIFVADVVDVFQNKEEGWEDSKAVLKVREVLQGQISEDTIYVNYSAGMICPAPAFYAKSTSVIAFLNKDESGNYHTHALSYGSKTLSEEGILVYKERISEMQSILAMVEGKESFEETLNWLVKCASHKATRWEGVYELSPESDFMSHYDRGKLINWEYSLDASQIEELRTVLFKCTDLGYQEVGLIDLVIRENDNSMFTFLCDYLKSHDLKVAWEIYPFLKRVSDLSNDQELKELIDQIDAVDYFDKKAEEKKLAFVKSFISKLY